MTTQSKFDTFAPQIKQLQRTRMTEAMERSGLTAKEGAPAFHQRFANRCKHHDLTIHQLGAVR